MKKKLILVLQNKTIHTSFKNPDSDLQKMKLNKEKLLHKQMVSFSLFIMWLEDSKLLFSLILSELQKELFCSFVAGL